MPVRLFWMWPNLYMTEEEKKSNWEGKTFKIHWSDGTTSEFPFKSLSHYIAVKRLVEGKDE